MNQCANNCDIHPSQIDPGKLLCVGCEYRLWREIHWLADIYDPLFPALTTRLNVEERIEQVKVSGAKDPMVQGMDLNDQAAGVRHEIRGIAYAGLGWILGRTAIGSQPGYLPQTIPSSLRWIALHLDQITGDGAGVDKIRHWGSRVVAARQKAEELITPQPLMREYWYSIDGMACSAEVGDEGKAEQECGGALGLWVVQGKAVTKDFTCNLNPGHVTTRDRAIKDMYTRRMRAKQGAALLRAILRKG